MTNSRQSLGRWGENVAAAFLMERGYTILETNVHNPGGEIDLIAQLSTVESLSNRPPGEFSPEAATGTSPYEPDRTAARPTVVFVEVKTRTSRTFGYPEEAVNLRKQEHLLNAAQYYIQQNPQLDCNWRIDVIAIQRNKRGEPPEIVHFENALGM